MGQAIKIADISYNILVDLYNISNRAYGLPSLKQLTPPNELRRYRRYRPHGQIRAKRLTHK
eukprot:5787984-Pleurochrysis_carterae.AAC.3